MDLVLALLTGVLGWLAYPSASLWPLMWVAFAPLLVALRGARLRRRLLLGWLAGFVLTLGSHYFIAGTIVHYGGQSWTAALSLFALYSAWQGLQLGIFAMGYGPLRRFGGRALWLLTVPVWFAAAERWFPVWFQAYISNALYPAPVLTQSLEWIGPSGLTALTVLPSCALALAVERGWGARRGSAVVLLGAVAVWGVLAVYGAWRIEAVRSVAATGHVRVALVQPNTTVAQKRNPDRATRLAVWERTLAMTREARGQKPDLIVWPEGALSVTYDPAGTERAPGPSESLRTSLSRGLHALARELRVAFVGAGLRVTEGGVGNSALFFAPGAERPIAYDKQKLVFLAEWVPFSDSCPALARRISGVHPHVAGAGFERFEVAGVPFVPSMCYEAVFPTITRRALANGGESAVLLNLTNDVWFGDTSEPEVHLMMQIPRAVENRAWLVRATNSGISAIVDPTGSVVAETGQMTPAILVWDVPRVAYAPTFYHRYGDLLVSLAGFLGLAATLSAAWKERRGRAAT